ncbi:hypothetical protein BE04_15045 [Sorangium cellulosum]|uniref:Uncharacterized protein n=1 Tax=Sorangium cellulosum TaxID=56 RepID=A0A150PXJ7_SORCE|nr:hypothetical protein BE04_15045 [Sorangium cellulosum]
MPPFELKQLPLFGPFWTAEAEIVRSDPALSRDFRELFVDRVPNVGAGRNALEARTVAALCFVRWVTLQLGGEKYHFTRNAAQPRSTDIPKTPDELRKRVSAGVLSLLLVEVQPPLGALGERLYCLAGEIDLDKVHFDKTHQGADLIAALGLEKVPQDGRPRLAAHGSGLSVHWRIALPWEDEPIAAPFLLTKRASGLRMSVDEERMTPDERGALAGAWERLARALNAGNPSFDPKGDARIPAWVNLEVTRPRSAPRLSWEMSPWQANRAIPLPVHVPSDELSLLLSDQRPNAQQAPPTSVARTTVSHAQIRKQGRDVLVEFGEARASGEVRRDLLRYRRELDAAEWKETFELAAVDVAYSPVEVPRLLRRIQSLDPPEWSRGTREKAAVPVDPPVLWAFMRLEDGWAQLPVPNLAEQMYLDAELARGTEDAVSPAPVLQGAVSYGNDKPGDRRLDLGEQAWSLTLTDIGTLAGSWTLTRRSAAEPWSLQQIGLDLHAPRLTLHGLIWLGTERPSARDALPSLDDWGSGLRSVPLRTPAPTDMFPPLVTLTVENLAFELRPGPAFPSAKLAAWSFTYGVDAALLGRMEAKGLRLLPAGTFARHVPLLWRRHPTVPMIQALPLTQTASPPNHPSASRQFMPLEFDAAVPDGWRFGVEGDAGAGAWPTPLGAARPAAAWGQHADLPIASLSLPGLLLDPQVKPANLGLGAEPATGLNARYRLDLPYCDEIHALAHLRKELAAPGATAALAGTPRPAGPSPSSPEALAEHWRRLAERSALASADAVDAVVEEAGTHVVPSLVEPLQWPVKPALSLDRYPGQLVLANRDGTSDHVTLTSEGALEGISGSFVEHPGTHTLRFVAENAPSDAYALVAGSMHAHADAARGYRDQRGLWRCATKRAGKLLHTPVRLEDAEVSWELVSTAVPLVMSPDASAERWQLWFRDLPRKEGSFTRESTLSTGAQDVNDPDASTRTYNHLNGYEWRLSSNAGGSFRLFHLAFYPLTLERVSFDDDGVTAVELVGRLQLPTLDAVEMEDLRNAVRVTFERRGEQGLALSAIAPASSACEWPLAGAELGDAPRLVVTQLSLSDDRHELRVEGGRLVFVLLGAQWTVPVAPFSFDRSCSGCDVSPRLPGQDAARPLHLKGLALRLDRQNGQHTLSVTLAAQLGSHRRRDRAPRTVFRADVSFSYTTKRRSWDAAWVAGSGRLFDDLVLVVPTQTAADPPAPSLVATPNSLEFTWRAYDPTSSARRGSSLQLLPGIHLARTARHASSTPGEAPGFVALSFDVLPVTDSVPSLELRTSFVEALLHCAWGERLQVDETLIEATRAQVFGSSAGDLAFGYTAEALDVAGQEATETLLLNGYLEMKDLVSWPVRIDHDAARTRLTLPSARGADPLSHVRHTLKILFNQHAVPQDIIVAGEGELLFQIERDKPWQFLAVVEHQLVEIFPSNGFGTFKVGHDRRWTALQEVRLLSPSIFKSFLTRLSQGNHQTPSPVGSLLPTLITFSGYLGGTLRRALAEAPQPALDRLPQDTLLVEASALHWINVQPVESSASPPRHRIQTTLQFLPGGIQQALLSDPTDYGPTDPSHPAWQLLTMPFLGRLHAEERDGIDVVGGGPGSSALQVDPVLALEAARRLPGPLPTLLLDLSSWAEAPATFTFPPFDDAAARTWARLDPASLEESWYRLQRPPREPSAPGIQSVLAAFPDTPARLSRPTALRRAFDSRGRSAPEPATSDPAALERPGSPQVEWRPDRMLVIQNSRDINTTSPRPPAWALTALQLAGGGLMEPRPTAVPVRLRYVAATALAIELAGRLLERPEDLGFSNDDWPVSIAVSPYLGMGFRPAPRPESTVLRLVVVELLCLDRATRRMRSAGNHVLERVDAGEVRKRAEAWAREAHRRLAPESPVAVLRFREIRESDGESAGAAVLSTTYSFLLVAGLELPDRLTRRALPLRASPAELRFRDGHFGGTAIPTSLADVELAPPQVTGVQPVYTRQHDLAAPAAPWGLSALRTTVQYTRDKDGIVGALFRGHAAMAGAGELVLWWQAVQHAVQFRAASSAGGHSAGLPTLFRASAIRSLLPVLPDPPLPLVPSGALRDGPWQPVVPGSVSYTLVGARPGVMLSMRHQVLRHAELNGEDEGAGPRRRGVVSGSVPVQHRVPRPPPLPQNHPAHLEAALRTWASRFDPHQSAMVTAAPADEAFILGSGGQPHRLRMRLVEPARGAIQAGWKGDLVFELASDEPEPLTAWSTASVELWHEGRTYIWGPPEPEDGESGYRFSLSREAVDHAIQHLPPGGVATVRVRVGRRHDSEGLDQTLTFPLRMMAPNAVPLPLDPTFIHFEDPEYNVKLATPSKRASRLVQTLDAGGNASGVHMVTLAADRGECNPDSVLMLRYDWDDDATDDTADETKMPRLSFDRVTPDGVSHALSLRRGDAAHDALPVAPAMLVAISLRDLRQGEGAAPFAHGESLLLTLTIPKRGRVVEQAEVALPVSIVDAPVTPAPEAAYALLRRQASNGGEQVECVRFAWNPEPSRVELVLSSDLRTGLVRRRAVFHWTDTARAAAHPRYDVQKITHLGSTHVPAVSTEPWRRALRK